MCQDTYAPGKPRLLAFRKSIDIPENIFPLCLNIARCPGVSLQMKTRNSSKTFKNLWKMRPETLICTKNPSSLYTTRKLTSLGSQWYPFDCSLAEFFTLCSEKLEDMFLQMTKRVKNNGMSNKIVQKTGAEIRQINQKTLLPYVLAIMGFGLFGDSRPQFSEQFCLTWACHDLLTLYKTFMSFKVIFLSFSSHC